MEIQNSPRVDGFLILIVGVEVRPPRVDRFPVISRHPGGLIGVEVVVAVTRKTRVQSTSKRANIFATKLYMKIKKRIRS